MSSESQAVPDFSFVVEDRGGSHSEAWLFASGAGKDVVQSMFRLAVLGAATDENIEFGRGFTSLLTETFTSYGHESNFGKSGPLALSDNGANLKSVVPSDYPFYRHDMGTVGRDHHKVCLEQVKLGLRSPDDVLKEVIQLKADNRAAYDLASRWFDQDGRKIFPNPTYHRLERDESDASRLDLTTVDRRKTNDQKLKAAKDTLFEEVPDGASAFSVPVVEFSSKLMRFMDRGSRDLRLTPPSTPFVGGTMVMHRTFGYIERDSRDFVAVTTLRTEQ